MRTGGTSIDPPEIQDSAFGIQNLGRRDHDGCLVSEERIGFRIQDSGFREDHLRCILHPQSLFPTGAR